MSSDKPAMTLDQLRTQLKHWQEKECYWCLQSRDASARHDTVKREVARLKAQIAAAEAAAEQRIVTEDDGGVE